MKVLPYKKVEEALDILSKEMEVFAPIARGPSSGYFLWGAEPESDDLMLDVLNTYLTPKNVLLPQTEKMYNFSAYGQAAKITDVASQLKDRVVFGIRSCDLKALDALDMVFLTKGFVDEFYQVRRDKTTIVANACYFPGSKCFCESMGVDRLDPPSADVILRDPQSKGYIWEVKTEKGQQLTDKIAHLLTEEDVQPLNTNPQRLKVDVEAVPALLKDSFEAPFWDDLAERCLNCGICTTSCPSCYCFDIQATVWGEEGYRFRCWDSCMYKEYSLMAGGHNPREQKKERFRNRFLHKFEFFNERYGTALCTGCGRCAVMCPVQVNILEVINMAKGAR